MDLERCQTLICVVETGNLSAAAGHLGYTTSGISRMISALETELGFSLFFRRHNGVEPTPECQAMLPMLRQFIFYGESCRQLAAKIRGLDTGIVRIGTAYSAYSVLLSKIISQFRDAYPHIVIQVKDGGSTDLIGLMNRHEIDLCLVSQREGDFQWFPLCRDQLMAWVPASHPLAGKPEVDITAFATEPYIDILPGLDSDNARLLKRFHIRPNVQFTVTDSYSAYSMVEAGLGIAMNNAMNSLNLSGSVKILPLAPRQTIEIGIAASKERSPAAEAFLNSLIASTF